MSEFADGGLIKDPKPLLPAERGCDYVIPKAKSYMDNPPAVGAPKNSRWGYLPCGCCNDGYGRHLR